MLRVINVQIQNMIRKRHSPLIKLPSQLKNVMFSTSASQTCAGIRTPWRVCWKAGDGTSKAAVLMSSEVILMLPSDGPHFESPSFVP